jgi:chemotaxis protein MotB
MSGRSNARFFDEREDGASGERWLLTYADMITLLLALFIVLFALSTIDKKKYQEFKTGVVQTFSSHTEPIPGGTGLLQQTSLVTHPVTTKSTVPTPLVNLEQRIQAALAQAGVSQDATVTLDQRGVVVRLLTDKVFFATYSADLGPVGDRVVDVVGHVVSTMTDAVQVEGYTDNQPITGSGPYKTNFELSAGRAMTVVDRLAAQDGVAPARLSGIGFGDTRPIVPNDSPAHQAANRRVDVVLLGSSSPASGG